METLVTTNQIVLAGEIEIDHRIGNPVADLVGMAFGDRLAGKQIIASFHGRTP